MEYPQALETTADEHEIPMLPNQCSICGEMFSTASNVTRHKNDKHSDNPTTWPCLAEGCDKVCTQKCNAKAHYESTQSVPLNRVCEIQRLTLPPFTTSLRLKYRCSRNIPKYRADGEARHVRCPQLFTEDSARAAHEKEDHPPIPNAGDDINVLAGQVYEEGDEETFDVGYSGAVSSRSYSPFTSQSSAGGSSTGSSNPQPYTPVDLQWDALFAVDAAALLNSPSRYGTSVPSSTYPNNGIATTTVQNSSAPHTELNPATHQHHDFMPANHAESIYNQVGRYAHGFGVAPPMQYQYGLHPPTFRAAPGEQTKTFLETEADPIMDGFEYENFNFLPQPPRATLARARAVLYGGGLGGATLESAISHDSRAQTPRSQVGPWTGSAVNQSAATSTMHGTDAAAAASFAGRWQEGAYESWGAHDSTSFPSTVGTAFTGNAAMSPMPPTYSPDDLEDRRWRLYGLASAMMPFPS